MVNSWVVSMEKSSFKAAMDAVVAGRACLLSYFGQIKHIEEKDKAAGLVSEADRESEILIKNSWLRLSQIMIF